MNCAAVSYPQPAVQSEFFHMPSTVNSCLPCFSGVPPESVVYVLKNKRLIFRSCTVCDFISTGVREREKVDGKGESKVVENIKASVFLAFHYLTAFVGCI